MINMINMIKLKFNISIALMIISMPCISNAQNICKGSLMDNWHLCYGQVQIKNLNYEGDFENGLFHGYGKTTIDGWTTIGQFSRGAPHGLNIVINEATGVVVRAEHVFGKLTGYGILTSRDGRQIVSGKWSNFQLIESGPVPDQIKYLTIDLLDVMAQQHRDAIYLKMQANRKAETSLPTAINSNSINNDRRINVKPRKARSLSEIHEEQFSQKNKIEDDKNKIAASTKIFECKSNSPNTNKGRLFAYIYQDFFAIYENRASLSEIKDSGTNFFRKGLIKQSILYVGDGTTLMGGPSRNYSRDIKKDGMFPDFYGTIEYNLSTNEFFATSTDSASGGRNQMPVHKYGCKSLM
jgi:MORN repeat